MPEPELVWMGIRAEELRRLLVDFHDFYYENQKSRGIALYRNADLHHYVLSVPSPLKKVAASWFNAYPIVSTNSSDRAGIYWLAGDARFQKT